MQLTNVFKNGPVELLAINRVLFNLPITSVDNAAVLTAQNEAAAVRDGVRHPQRLNSAAQQVLDIHVMQSSYVQEKSKGRMADMLTSPSKCPVWTLANSSECVL